MAYNFSKIVDYDFDDAISKLTDELKEEGFGVLTEIDMKATLKKKIDVDFRRYKILGACNPPSAYKALQAEENIGVLLPCNVVVQEKEDGTVQVSAVNPLETMKSVGNKSLEEIASDIGARLKRVIENI